MRPRPTKPHGAVPHARTAGPGHGQQYRGGSVKLGIPAKSVLIVNPRSGGGKAARFDLVAQCRARGIDPIALRTRRRSHDPGDGRRASRRRRPRHGGRGRVTSRGRRGRGRARSPVRVRSRRHPEPLRRSISASTATTSSARSTRSATGMNGASISAASTAAPS